VKHRRPQLHVASSCCGAEGLHFRWASRSPICNLRYNQKRPTRCSNESGGRRCEDPLSDCLARSDTHHDQVCLDICRDARDLRRPIAGDHARMNPSRRPRLERYGVLQSSPGILIHAPVESGAGRFREVDRRKNAYGVCSCGCSPLTSVAARISSRITTQVRARTAPHTPFPSRVPGFVFSKDQRDHCGGRTEKRDNGHFNLKLAAQYERFNPDALVSARGGQHG
jgi:hypothetical protein